MTRLGRSLVGLAAASLLATVVHAEPRPCDADIEKFCRGVTPDRGAILECLRPHAAELSDRCRKTLIRMQKRRESMAGRQRQIGTQRARGTATPAPSGADPRSPTPAPRP